MIYTVATFVEKFVIDSFMTFSPEVTSLTFADAIIVLFWSITLSLIVSIIRFPAFARLRPPILVRHPSFSIYCFLREPVSPASSA